MLIKSKVARVKQSMTPFWKEERWGYNIYQNEQKQFFWPRPPIPLRGIKCKKFTYWVLPLIKTGLIRTYGYRGVYAKKIVFVHFDICYSPIFLLSKMGSYFVQLALL